MEYRTTGRSGIDISVLGFGAGHIGGDNDDENTVEKILNYVLDSGINLIDTARGYGLSEERIGRYISAVRRKDAVLCTKVGYGVEGVPDWTYECIIKGVERALLVMKTDFIDIVLLHTCPEQTLRAGDVIEALASVKSRGLVRAIGYSGDNEDLDYAVSLDQLDCFEGSFNICDQGKASGILAKIRNDNKCFIAKRPIANAPWRFTDRPSGLYCEAYWDRMKQMNLFPDIADMTDIALRYAAFTEGVTSVITGTADRAHLDDNRASIEAGSLSASVYAEIRQRYLAAGADWRSEI